MKHAAVNLAAAFALLGGAQPLLAGAVAVPYADLDLSTEQGRKELDDRIDAAAKKVCGFDDVRTGSRVVPQDARDCYAQARAELEKRIAGLTRQKAAGG